MEESNVVIKRTYDKYQPLDFQYGQDDSTNLNPKREISFDNLDRIAVKLQQVTDDIIRKKIEKPENLETPIRGPLGGDGVVQGIPLQKQKAIAQSGGKGNALIFPVIDIGMSPGPMEKLLEELIAKFPVPALLEDLDKPPILDCEVILMKYGFDDAEEDDNDEPATTTSKSGSSSSSSSGGSSDSDDDDDDDGGEEGPPEENPPKDEESETAECAEIELGWLKILLILVKVIKIFRMIIDFVISLIVPILDIVILAIGAWLNPPNIPMIVQRIIELVIAIVIMIISLVIQLIWNLLNLDCVCDQVFSVIAQIQEAMAMFSSLMSAFNPAAVNMIANKIQGEVLDPVQNIMDTITQKSEDWGKFVDEMKQMTDPANLKALKDKMQKEIASGIQTGVNNIPQVGTVKSLYGSMKGLVNGPLADSLTAIKAAKTGMQEFGTLMKDVGSAAQGKEAKMLTTPQFKGLKFTKAQRKEE